VYDGLRSQTLKGGKIPGVGPKLKERLAAAGVNAAVDVSEARLRGLPGFGEAKIASILVWRRQPSSGHRSGVALTR
jgi:DNA-binding helix-hairpin-helix protein with protein kinase domain